ncbi:MAG TPA: hypothetical protein VN722_10755 [Hanamia sp.]|jgi:hypothetical protein|nr:hypothetical protein [Hanamia sp.]
MNFKKKISPIRISTHAIERARERFQWSSGTVEVMAEKAFKSGLKRHHINGTLKKYVDSKTKDFTGKNIVLYNGSIYIFSDNYKLITIWPLKSFYRSLANLFQKFCKLDCLILSSNFLFDFFV